MLGRIEEAAMTMSGDRAFVCARINEIVGRLSGVDPV